jgi:hypothetical protein
MRQQLGAPFISEAQIPRDEHLPSRREQGRAARAERGHHESVAGEPESVDPRELSRTLPATSERSNEFPVRTVDANGHRSIGDVDASLPIDRYLPDPIELIRAVAVHHADSEVLNRADRNGVGVSGMRDDSNSKTVGDRAQDARVLRTRDGVATKDREDQCDDDSPTGHGSPPLMILLRFTATRC